MKIRFTESVFQDYSRVGYDNVIIRYRIVEDEDAEPSDFSVPKSFTKEQALNLASRMVRLIYDEGIGYAEAYNRLVGGKNNTQRAFDGLNARRRLFHIYKLIFVNNYLHF